MTRGPRFDSIRFLSRALGPVAAAGAAFWLASCGGGGGGGCKTNADCTGASHCDLVSGECVLPVCATTSCASSSGETSGGSGTTSGNTSGTSGGSSGTSGNTSGTSGGSSGTSGNTSGTSGGSSGTSGNTSGTSGGSSGTSGTSGWTSTSSGNSGSSGSSGTSGASGSSGSSTCVQSSQSSTKGAGGGGVSCGSSYCYGGWWCDENAKKCSSSQPSDCTTTTSSSSGSSGSSGATGSSSSSGASGSTTSSSSGSSGSSGTTSGGTPGSIGPSGGSIPSLLFAVVGDTRPGMSGDATACQYPQQIINGLYQQIEAQSPHPFFTITTGDYMCCGSGCSGSDSGCSSGQQLSCAQQAGIYTSAAQQFKGQVFSVLGNHECATSTSSNCGPSGQSTENYTAFLTNILGTFGITPSVYPTLANSEAYYRIDIKSSDATNPWTAKFLMLAANAWDSAQSSWLTAQLATQTTYTFVVRHEPTSTTNCGSGCSDSNSIVQSAFGQGQVTMMLVGHSHIYRQDSISGGYGSGSGGGVELVIGNGGAPLSSGNFGYEICQQVTGGNITCTQYEYQSNAVVGTVTVNAAGATQ